MSSGSSIPAVIDTLVALIADLPAISTVTATVDVSDGPGESTADMIVTVGGTVEPTADATLATASTRGAAAVSPMDEDYVISVDIDYVANTSNQKLMRDEVFAVWDAICDAIRADATLGGLLVKRTGAEPTSVVYHQTPPEEAQERIRSALINAGIRIRNRI